MANPRKPILAADSLDQRCVQTVVAKSFAHQELLTFLSGRFSYHSMDEWRANIAAHYIVVNHQPTRPEYILQENDVISYLISHIPEPEVQAEYTVLYEDEFLLAVDKPGDLPSHPAGPFYKNTLWFLLKKKYPAVHLINRLDRETSGIMLVAKNAKTAALLTKNAPTMEKRYQALVFGSFPVQVIDANGFLEPDSNSVVRKKRRFTVDSTAENRQTAQTILRPVKIGAQYSLVDARPLTGRLHQIRATLYSLGFPLLGDKLYGPNDLIYLKNRDNLISEQEWRQLVLPRQALHAYQLSFYHPNLQDVMNISAPIPAMFDKITKMPNF